ncbi:MAG: hypothetical protein NT027_06235, partial [Proteobacteria bacterium]|nr:hypothetical protein [Pseudomonadota bacterium]
MKSLSRNGFKSINSLVILMITVASFLGRTLEAGHFVGNGGDHVRATFLKMGQAVIDVLENTEQGQQIVSQHSLVIGDLSKTLDINVVEVRN